MGRLLIAGDTLRLEGTGCIFEVAREAITSVRLRPVIRRDQSLSAVRLDYHLGNDAEEYVFLVPATNSTIAALLMSEARDLKRQLNDWLKSD